MARRAQQDDAIEKLVVRGAKLQERKSFLVDMLSDDFLVTKEIELLDERTLPFSYLVQTDPSVVLFASIAAEVLGHFIHLNAKVSLGRWNWLLANPQTHRVHHSYAPQHIDKNFAAYFPLIDVIFGTYYAPDPHEFPTTGVKSGYVPTMTEAVSLPVGTLASKILD